MGRKTKITPEIKAFIIEKKKDRPSLSCRGLECLIKAQFDAEISKSSINSLLKTEGLNLPVVNRRTIKKKVLPQAEPGLVLPSEESLKEPSEAQTREGTGSFILKAVDSLIGGSYYIAESVKKRLSCGEASSLSEVENRIFQSLFSPDKDKDILPYPVDSQTVTKITADVERIISTVPQEVRGIKVNLLDGGVFYLDGQMHTVWSTPHLPYSFSTTLYNIRSYVNRHFYKDKPFILLMAPGYGRPSEEFFNFLLALDSLERKLGKLTLYGNNFENLDIISFVQPKRRFFIFGLWPWQYAEHKQLVKTGEFKQYYLQALEKEFYLADIEIVLLQPITKQEVMLRGVSIKEDPAGEEKVVALSNLSPESASAEKLAGLYLDSWPNLQETYQDLKRKVEFFTYTGSAHSHFSLDKLKLGQDKIAFSNVNLRALFDEYIKILELYFRWHFLPAGPGDSDFPAIKERFFGLRVFFESAGEIATAVFQAPEGFQFPEELEYFCRRINERGVMLEGKRLFCDIEPVSC